MRRFRPARGALVVASAALASLSCGERHARVDVTDAPSHDRARSLTLEGAMILIEAGGSYDRVCSSSAPARKGGSSCVDHHFYVFPVVPRGASSARTVSAWVTCSAREKSYEECEAWVRGYAGEITGTVAVRVGDGAKVTRSGSGWEDAIDDATKRHGLTATPRGPVLRLGKK